MYKIKKKFKSKPILLNIHKTNISTTSKEITDIPLFVNLLAI